MDRISRLSDDLLLQILSHLPTKDVPVTSLLSKRWESLWCLVSKIEFDDSKYQNDYESFTKFVYRSLWLNKAPVLHTLILNLSSNCHVVDIGIWIDIAVARHVCNLIVTIQDLPGPVSLPRTIYTCKTLETLTLSCCHVSDVLCLPSLNILHLDDVEYASLPKILSGCPNLEKLVVQFVRKEGEGKDIIVTEPHLRRLIVYDVREKRKGGVYVIEAPCVEHLNISDDAVYTSRRIVNMPNLVSADVFITQKVTHKFLKALASACILCLSISLHSKVPKSGIFFHRLVHLELYTDPEGWWDLLTQILNNSPKLASLKLTDDHEIGLPSRETPDCWKRPNTVPDSLETFAWCGYKGRQGDLEVATYFTKNAKRLKTATISPRPDDVKDKYMIVKDLISACTPSPSCQIIFD